MSKQLYEKLTDGSFVKIEPKTNIQGITDKDTNQSLKSVLNKYNHIYISYRGTISEIRTSIPIETRRPHLIITYQDNIGNFITEQFIGKENQLDNINWSNNSNWSIIVNNKHLKEIGYAVEISNGIITYNHLSQSLKELLEKNNNINIYNYPDEEDISLTSPVGRCNIKMLHFKDRKYIYNSNNGKGNIILRKNNKSIESSVSGEIIETIGFDGFIDCGIYIEAETYTNNNYEVTNKIFYSSYHNIFVLAVLIDGTIQNPLYKYYNTWNIVNNINHLEYNTIDHCTNKYVIRKEPLFYYNSASYQSINNKLEATTNGLYLKYINELTQKDFNNLSNTRFIIRYDFVLTEDIYLSENCELVFEGGTFKNGKIDLNKAKLINYIGDKEDYFINCIVNNFHPSQI